MSRWKNTNHLTMFPFFSYFDHRSKFVIIFFFSLFFLLSLPLIIPATTDSSSADSTNNTTWHALIRFLHAEKGRRVDGVAELKTYFHRFGYLPPPPVNNNMTFTDFFDQDFETALISYQKNLGLPVTGRLDSETMSLIVSPRCGVHDTMTMKTTRRFTYFDGEPRWGRSLLTYAFSPEHTIGYVSPSELRGAFQRAFSRWSEVIPVSFRETEEYSSADIRIGWYGGEHGDGEAFDGVLGVLGHAFSPENGRMHLDAAERWAVDMGEEKSREAVDLESVATHEIGHVLGLGHSSVKEAVMYPSLSPRSKKLELQQDDVDGIQFLYGSNPNSRFESDLSSARGMLDLLVTPKGLIATIMLLLACFFSLPL